MTRVWIAVTLGAVLVSTSAVAQTPAVTVDSLVKQDYTIVGVIPSSAGPGLFLQKKEKVYLCLVAETPRSPTVGTRYCKPVQ